MDIHATILDATRIKADPSNTPDGISLLPLLKHDSALERESIYFHYPNYAFHKANRFASAIRSGKYKLLWFYDDDSVELYDLKNDISESRNIADEMPEHARELKDRLKDWLKKTKASRPQKTE